MAAPVSRRTVSAVLAIAAFGLVAEATQVESVSAESSSRHRERAPAACGIPHEFAGAFRAASRETALPLGLLAAVAWEESRMDPDAVSPAGARGLFQLMPGTATVVAVDGSGPTANVRAGARYLRLMVDRFQGDVELALAAYNAGPTAVEQAGGAPSLETLRYALNVEARAARLGDCS